MKSRPIDNHKNEARAGTPRTLPARAAAPLAATLPVLAWMAWPGAEQPAASPAPPRPVPATAAAARPQPVPAVYVDAQAALPMPAAAAPVTPEPADAGPRPGTPPDTGDAGAVLFITIVGDQTFYHWGRAGDRPPRIDGLAVGAPTAASPDAAAVTAAAFSAAAEGAAADYGGQERPYGPAPQECPRTLPPGSSQADADALRSQAGCRYLASCSAEAQECTWHYQGRG